MQIRDLWRVLLEASRIIIYNNEKLLLYLAEFPNKLQNMINSSGPVVEILCPSFFFKFYSESLCGFLEKKIFSKESFSSNKTFLVKLTLFQKRLFFQRKNPKRL